MGWTKSGDVLASAVDNTKSEEVQVPQSESKKAKQDAGQCYADTCSAVGVVRDIESPYAVFCEAHRPKR